MKQTTKMEQNWCGRKLFLGLGKPRGTQLEQGLAGASLSPCKVPRYSRTLKLVTNPAPDSSLFFDTIGIFNTKRGKILVERKVDRLHYGAFWAIKRILIYPEDPSHSNRYKIPSMNPRHESSTVHR